MYWFCSVPNHSLGFHSGQSRARKPAASMSTPSLVSKIIWPVSVLANTSRLIRNTAAKHHRSRSRTGSPGRSGWVGHSIRSGGLAGFAYGTRPVSRSVMRSRLPPQYQQEVPGQDLTEPGDPDHDPAPARVVARQGVDDLDPAQRPDEPERGP